MKALALCPFHHALTSCRAKNCEEEAGSVARALKHPNQILLEPLEGQFSTISVREQCHNSIPSCRIWLRPLDKHSPDLSEEFETATNSELGIFSYRWSFGESHASRKAEGGAKHVFSRSHKSNTVHMHWVWHFIQDISYPLHNSGQPQNPLKRTLLHPECKGYAWYIWLADKTQETKRSWIGTLIQVEREIRKCFSEICASIVTNLRIFSLRVFGLRETIYMNLGQRLPPPHIPWECTNENICSTISDKEINLSYWVHKEKQLSQLCVTNTKLKNFVI